MKHERLALWTSVCAAVLLLAGLPAQVLGQAAPTGPQAPAQTAVKAVVVVQQGPAPAQPQPQPQTPAQAPGPGKAQVVVQTPGPAAPAAKPAAQPIPELTFTTPQAANLGENFMLQAFLVDPDGKPITRAAVDFSSTAKFLNTDGSVVFAHAVTDTQGTASVDWQPRSEGSLTLTASFAGDKRFVAARATATVEVNGDRQLYQQQAGVSVPGLNAAPPVSVTVGLSPSVSPWPRLSGWPLAMVLLIVWSLYARAVWLLFTIARGRGPASSREVRS